MLKFKKSGNNNYILIIERIIIMSVSKEELNIKDLYGKHCTLSKDDFL